MIVIVYHMDCKQRGSRFDFHLTAMELSLYFMLCYVQGEKFCISSITEAIYLNGHIN